MKRSELVNLIKKIVKNEVKYEVGKQLNEIFIDEDKPKINKEIKLTDIYNNKKSSKPKKEVHYTSDKILNKILNETIGGISYDVPNPAMGGLPFSTKNINKVIGHKNGQSRKIQREVAAIETIRQSGKSIHTVPEYITNALTKDYRKTVKTFNRRKK